MSTVDVDTYDANHVTLRLSSWMLPQNGHPSCSLSLFLFLLGICERQACVLSLLGWYFGDIKPLIYYKMLHGSTARGS